MLKAVLFDFDGTLADTGHIMYKAYKRLSQKHDLPPVNYAELEQIRAMSIRDRLKKAGMPLFKLPGLLRETRQVYSEYISSAEPFSGIEELIQSLKAKYLLLGIVSSNAEKNIHDFLSVHNLNLFDHISTTSSLFGKHRTITQSLKELRINPDEAVYVGDELRDIIACRKVPIRIIAVSWGYDHLSLLREGNPDYIVHSPQDILDIVGKL